MQFQQNKVLIGTDPEILLTRNGEFVSAHGLIQGDKANPAPVNKGAVQVDGMALEFNIDPAANVQEFVENIKTVYAQLREQVPEDFVFSDKCTAHFNTDYFQQRSLSEREMGCEADFCAYEEAPNTAPDMDTPMRTAGGHVHIGWRAKGFLTDSHIEVCKRVVMACDAFLGLPSVLFDTDNERRSMYGASGCYRPKPYGVEYRTLSNAWIQTEELQRFVYSNIEQMLAREAEWDAFPYDKIRAVIDQSDTDAAKELCEMLNIPTFGG